MPKDLNLVRSILSIYEPDNYLSKGVQNKKKKTTTSRTTVRARKAMKDSIAMQRNAREVQRLVTVVDAQPRASTSRVTAVDAPATAASESTATS